MPDRGTQLDVVYMPPFAGGVLQGPGRWFKTDEGFIWTNDNGNLNLLDFSDYAAVKNFNMMRQVYAAKGMTASQVFDALVDTQTAEVPETEVVAGDLSDLDNIFTDTIEQEEERAILAAAQPTPVLYTYGITTDPDGNVLELVKSGRDGLWIRQDRDWTPITLTDDEDQESTVFGQEWHNVSEAAITIFDGSQDVDHLTKAYFDPAILL